MQNYVTFFLWKTDLVFKNNVSIYLPIFGDFDNLKLGKILDILLSFYGCSIESLWLHIQVKPSNVIRCFGLLNKHWVLFLYSSTVLTRYYKCSRNANSRGTVGIICYKQ